MFLLVVVGHLECAARGCLQWYNINTNFRDHLSAGSELEIGAHWLYDDFMSLLFSLKKQERLQIIRLEWKQLRGINFIRILTHKLQSRGFDS
jgi:hypothetical protein